MTPLPPPGLASLCDGCVHQQLVRNTRGSVFSLCRRHRTDPEHYRKYPPLPVVSCRGFEAGERAAPADPAESAVPDGADGSDGPDGPDGPGK